jgi:hypothetical protein
MRTKSRGHVTDFSLGIFDAKDKQYVRPANLRFWPDKKRFLSAKHFFAHQRVSAVARLIDQWRLSSGKWQM